MNTPANCRDASCGVALVPQRKAKPYAGQWVGVHGGRGLCRRCYHRHRHNGTLIDFERNYYHADELLEELERLRCSRREAAKRLGIPYPSFDRAICRALAKRRQERQPA